jgi:two-component sensor histidine kinase
MRIEADWASEGTASVAGRYKFADYGDILDGLMRGEPLIVDNVHSDPRTAAHAQTMRDLDIAALVNMPVRERGQTIAIALVHDSEPRIWASEELTFLRNIVDRVEMSVARIQAEADQTTVNHELSHRMKNTLAMVQAIASQTLRSVPDRVPVEAFMQRVHALAAAHDVLLQHNWTGARIDAIVAAVLGALNRLDRFDIAGPRIDLSPRATLSITLLLHELATNAMKYGALSNDAGRVTLNWRESRSDRENELILTWRESGGPAVEAPAGSGFGSRLIRMGLIGTGGVELRYPTSGFEADFRAPFDQIERA